MKIFRLGALAIAFVLLFFGCVTSTQSLNNYEPQNQEEAAIKELLASWESTINNNDIAGNLALWHDEAVIAVGRERIQMTKEEYAKVLPGNIKKNPAPKLGAPKIDISGSTAKARVDITSANRKLPFIFYLIKGKGGEWQIASWEYK